MQDTLKRANAEVSNEDHLDVRMGLHYGMVFEKENDAFGDAVNMAQRVQSKATGGQVLLSRSVRDLVRAEPQIESRSLGAIELKGSPEPVEVFELNSAPPLRAASPAHRILAQALTSIALVAALVAGATSWRGHRKSAVENPQPNPQRAFAKVMLRRWDSRGRLSELALGQEDILAGDQFQLVYKALEAHHLYAAYFDSVKGEYELIFPTRDSLEPVSPAGDVLIPKGDLHFFIDQGPDSQSLLFVVSKEPLRLVEDQRNAPRPSGSALRQAFEEIRSHGQAVCQWKQDSPQWAALECDSNAKITWVELPIGPH